MTYTDTDSHFEFDNTAKKFFDKAEIGLPEALYRLRDGSYADRAAFDAERADSDEDDALTSPLSNGALLLNRSTKSYLTPFGFKALFRQRPKVIRERFARAGLDTKTNYFLARSPDILIHQADDHFVPVSHLPKEERLRPLLLRFREEDIYLQNFNHEGTKRTGSYIAYARAGQELRERHAEALQGIETEYGEENVQAAETGAESGKRTFKYRPRGRGLVRRDRPSNAGKPAS